MTTLSRRPFKGTVHPITLELLRQVRLPTEGLRSKSWDEFAAPGAPPLDFVFTVCDNTAGEVCPYLNLEAHPRVELQVGSHRIAGDARRAISRS